MWKTLAETAWRHNKAAVNGHVVAADSKGRRSIDGVQLFARAVSRRRISPLFGSTIHIKAHATMGRGRIHAKGWHAQLRIASSKQALEPTPDIAAQLDAILRRSRSIESFVIRLSYIPSRRELVLSIAALRREAYDRADVSVLPLLRRLIAEVEPGRWVVLPDDERRLDGLSVFCSYEIIDDDVARREMAEMQSAVQPNTFISTSAVPVLVAKAPATTSPPGGASKPGK